MDNCYLMTCNLAPSPSWNIIMDEIGCYYVYVKMFLGKHFFVFYDHIIVMKGQSYGNIGDTCDVSVLLMHCVINPGLILAVNRTTMHTLYYAVWLPFNPLSRP